MSALDDSYWVLGERLAAREAALHVAGHFNFRDFAFGEPCLQPQEAESCSSAQMRSRNTSLLPALTADGRTGADAAQRAGLKEGLAIQTTGQLSLNDLCR